MRINWKILICTTVLLIIFVIMSQTVKRIILEMSPTSRFILRLSGIPSVLSYPVLFVVVLYLVGRGLNIKGDLRVIFTSLLLGCLVIPIYELIQLIQFRSMLLPIDTIWMILNLVIDTGKFFFTGLGALAFGALTFKKQENRTD